ncbi:MAG: hypothetical protein NT113_13325 [Hyphomicrobiales bacterium]|nr:hypothetical protein [Hyphomicrobiales bacterium]
MADEIMEMSAANPAWDAGKLAEHFNCRREYVRTAARRLKFKIKVFRVGLWKPEDDARLRHLREVERLTWAKIAEVMDRPQSSCSNRHDFLVSPPIKTNLVPDRVNIPADRFADRDARINREHRDLTAAFMGDPKPGFSALERRA